MNICSWSKKDKWWTLVYWTRKTSDEHFFMEQERQVMNTCLWRRKHKWVTLVSGVRKTGDEHLFIELKKDKWWTLLYGVRNTSEHVLPFSRNKVYLSILFWSDLVGQGTWHNLNCQGYMLEAFPTLAFLRSMLFANVKHLSRVTICWTFSLCTSCNYFNPKMFWKWNEPSYWASFILIIRES